MALRNCTYLCHYVRVGSSHVLVSFVADAVRWPVRHVMTTTQPKRPGEVNDPSGFGNDDFDKGLKDSKFGYPVLGLYKLNPPIRSGDMKSKFDISPPQGYLYAPRKLVDDIPLHSMEKLF